jgi:hypothetical protein
MPTAEVELGLTIKGGLGLSTGAEGLEPPAEKRLGLPVEAGL